MGPGRPRILQPLNRQEWLAVVEELKHMENRVTVLAHRFRPAYGLAVHLRTLRLARRIKRFHVTVNRLVVGKRK